MKSVINEIKKELNKSLRLKDFLDAICIENVSPEMINVLKAITQ